MKVLLKLLQTEASIANLDVDDANVEVGMACTLFKSRGLHDESSMDELSSEKSTVESDDFDMDSDPETGMSPQKPYA